MAAPTSVYGVRETLAELKELDKALFFETVREIKKAAAPMVKELERALPSEPPLSGMARGRLSWRKMKVNVKYGGRKDRNKDEWPLLKLELKDGAGQLFDMAGKGGSSPLADRLTARFGGPSRAMWRNTDRLLAESSEAVKDAIARASEKVNRKLVEKGSI